MNKEIKWRSKLKKLLEKKATPEEMYFLLHQVINKGYPTFYETIVKSKEWQDWEKVAYKKGYDWAESTETGWLSPKHFKAFLRWENKEIDECDKKFSIMF